MTKIILIVAIGMLMMITTIMSISITMLWDQVEELKARKPTWRYNYTLPYIERGYTLDTLKYKHT